MSPYRATLGVAGHDQGAGYANSEITRLAMATGLLPRQRCLSWIPGVTKVREWANNYFDDRFNKALNNSRSSISPPARTWLQRRRNDAKYVVSRMWQQEQWIVATFTNIYFNPAASERDELTTELMNEFVNLIYVPRVNSLLQLVVAQLANSPADFSNHTNAEIATNRHVSWCLRNSNNLHASFAKAKDTHDYWLLGVAECIPVLSLIPSIRDYYKAMDILAAGVNCGNVAFQMSERLVGLSGVIVSPTGDPVPTPSMRASRTSAQSSAAASKTIRQELIQALETQATHFEAVARDLEVQLLARDASASAALLETLEGVQQPTEDAQTSALVSLFASYGDGRLSVPEYVPIVDSLETEMADAFAQRLAAERAVAEWLTDTAADSLHEAAVEDLRGAIDATMASSEQTAQFMATVLGQASEAFLLVTSPRVTRTVPAGDTCTIAATFRNLGGAPATATAALLAPTGSLECMNGCNVPLGTLGPGESRTISWIVRPFATISNPDSTTIVSFTILPDTAETSGLVASGEITVAYNPALVGVEAAAPAIEVTFRPNPNRGRLEISFSTSTDGPVSLEVVDVSGRRWSQWTKRFAAGRHMIVWDGVSPAGTRAPAGVYFLRLIVEGRLVTRRFVTLH